MMIIRPPQQGQAFHSLCLVVRTRPGPCDRTTAYVLYAQYNNPYGTITDSTDMVGEASWNNTAEASLVAYDLSVCIL
jgi:hypothetical protein